MSSDDDSYSSSSSSDDEFLTIGNDGASSQDREAMIRKKLLESFYGKTVVDEKEEGGTTSNDQHEQQHGDTPSTQDVSNVGLPSTDLSRSESVSSSHHGEASSGHAAAAAAAGQSDDLDSPYFDADAHTNQLVHESSVHDLLETEERLALQVRTLDSTMQTLVYENYSKFIDATDAIRSIGVSVQANDEGLAKLASGMHTIDEQSRAVEDALGGLRDQVAEKLRVKRLLTRLDALLKLPATLKQQIAAGNYRSAAKSYLSASSILSKHSAGFESLKSIETECQAILTEMVSVLKHKLVNWSGRKKNLGTEDLDFEDTGEDGGSYEDNQFEDDEKSEEYSAEQTSGWTPPPEPPTNVSGIFECAGAILMLLPAANGSDGASFVTNLTADECKVMALTSSVRLLDRLLDLHHIELQERTFEMQRLANAKVLPTKPASMQDPMSSSMDAPPSGAHLIPNSFLDSVLEAATLYGITFGNGRGDSTDGDSSRLGEFVSEAFATFLAHVRSVLLEQSASSENENDEDEDDENKMESQDAGDAAYLEISQAMTHLVRSVRDLASGLALPEVGIDVDVASCLVDKTVDMTESMVRRRVTQKFHGLRIQMLRKCLKPFSSSAIDHPAENGDGTPRVVNIVQMASVALSDAMQLVDDVIRSILSGGIILGANATAVDFAMVKQAVETSANHFAIWLASALEIIAGCENSDPKLIIDAASSVPEGEDDETQGAQKSVSSVPIVSVNEDVVDVSDDVGVIEKAEIALQELVGVLVDEASKAAYSDLTLAIAEMCRLADRSVIENINHSVVSSASEGMGKKARSSGIFASVGRSGSQQGVDGEAVSQRFRLASSRILTLYAMNRGGDAASIACNGFYDMACSLEEGIPSEPRASAWQMLEVIKQAAIDCAIVFGGEICAGPVPEMADDDEYAMPSPLKLSSLSNSAFGGAIKGLQLDVERMFTEKVAVYPHAFSFLNFSRTTVVTIALHIALKAMMEQTRTCMFTGLGYQQLLVDVEFLRCLIPHFVEEDFKFDGADACTILFNVLNDIVLNAGQRCKDMQFVDQLEFYDVENDVSRTPRAIVKDFMTPPDENRDGDETSDEEKTENILLRFTISTT